MPLGKMRVGTVPKNRGSLPKSLRVAKIRSPLLLKMLKMLKARLTFSTSREEKNPFDYRATGTDHV
jgi:hypothetical protein